MGGGSWSAKTYDAARHYRDTTGASAFAYSDSGATEVHADLDPKDATREARDSGEHPESTPVAVLFDVTGSMGTVPRTLQAKLPALLGLLLRKGYLADPQIMFGAIGDATCDRAPLQVAQFESDNRMDEHLGKIYLEGGGGGQKTESYELALWYMARRVQTDAWDKRRKRGYCNTPDAPVWMADQTFTPIGKLEPGDQVMGWTHVNGRRSLVATEVQAVQHRLADNVVQVTMESGRVLKCTADHRWLSAWHSVQPGGDIWTNVQNRFDRPALLSHVVEPCDPLPPEMLADAAWLAGVYDGEGCRNEITQSRTHNPEVCARIERTLTRLGFSWTYRMTDGKCGGYFILGGLQGAVNMLNRLPITRRDSLLSSILTSKWARYRRRGEQPPTMRRQPDRVAAIEPLPPQEVVSLQTTTHNYVAWGYASSNCFIIGDEMAYPRVKAREIARFLGGEVTGDMALEAIIAEVTARWETYYILPAGASYAGDDQVLDFWRKYLGQHVIQLDDLDAVCETIGLTVGLAEDATDLDGGLADLREVGSMAGGVVGKALAPLGSGRSPVVTQAAPPDLTSESGSVRL